MRLLSRPRLCCCCCRRGGAVSPAAAARALSFAARAKRLAELRELFAVVTKAGGEVGAIEQEINELMRAAESLAMPRYTVQPVAALPPGGAPSNVPVWVEYLCGGARDCAGTSEWWPNEEAAVAGADSWLNAGPTRYVQIYTAPGGILLRKIGPGSTALVINPGATRATAVQAIAEQRAGLTLYGG